MVKGRKAVEKQARALQVLQVEYVPTEQVQPNSLVTGGSGATGGALILPAPLAADFITWADRYVHRAYRHDDGRLAFYLTHVNPRDFHIPVPNLMQHLAPNDSLAGNNHPSRVTPYFAGEDDHTWDPTRVHRVRPLPVGAGIDPHLHAGWQRHD